MIKIIFTYIKILFMSDFITLKLYRSCEFNIKLCINEHILHFYRYLVVEKNDKSTVRYSNE